MGILVKTGNGNVLGFFKAMLSELQYINDLFYNFYELKKYEIIFTGQIIYMKKYLNDQFDPVDRRIYLYTNIGFLSPFFYNISEDDGDYIYNVSEGDGPYLQYYNESISLTDFTVYVPTSLSYDANTFNAAIRKYKLEDKTYNIVTY